MDLGQLRAQRDLSKRLCAPIDEDDVDTNAPEFTRTKRYGGSLHASWDLGGATLTSITGYERYDARGPGDTDYTPLEISRGYTDATSRQWTQELRLSSPQRDRFDWILGLYYFHEKIDSSIFSARLPNGSVPAQPITVGASPANAYSATFYGHKAESGAVSSSRAAHCP